jgi:hypothetical protein
LYYTQLFAVDTGIFRGVPATLLTPNGNVLILSGENGDINQIKFANLDASADPRFPQLFDPLTYNVTTELAREDIFRGYHNFASILKDGSVLVGGGFNQWGGELC